MVECEPGIDLELVGLPPFEVRCVATPEEEGVQESEVVWRFGDGDTATGFVVDHVYDQVGRFPLSIDVGAETVRGNVTTCAAPRPVFTWEFLGELEYRMINETPPTPGCLSQLRWEVFRGKNREAEPVFVSEIWEPTFSVPAEGDYTVVLTIGGIGGSGAAAADIDASGGLGDAERENSMAATCAGPPGSTAAWALPFALLAVPLRRRSRA